MTALGDLWVYLAREPLAALAATLSAWWVALRVQALCRFHPLANPVLIAVAMLAGALLATGVDYRAYFQGAQFVHFLLGPATVALAVPLARQWREVRGAPRAILASIAAGGGLAALTGALLGRGDPGLARRWRPAPLPPPWRWACRRRWAGCRG